MNPVFRDIAMMNHKPGKLRAAVSRTIVYICVVLIFSVGTAQAQSLFVRAGAASGGDGSKSAPFNSLAAVEKASESGDTIVVLPSPAGTSPLDGGIALKKDQKLIGGGPPITAKNPPSEVPRITNSDKSKHNGDAVVLADGVEVSNLAISKSYRGGIYGKNVTRVRIHGNDLSGTNTSCTEGFLIYFSGKKFTDQIPLLSNGWAAIMIDEDKGTEWLSIRNNYIHDGQCNDGIDIRATGDAQAAARVSDNRLTRLAQGPKKSSILALGMQTRDRAILSVDSDHNSETYIGSSNANCEGLFSNQTGGYLSWNINHNTFAHGVGGGSCNGAEFFNGTGDASADVYISHSSFKHNPGDMIQFDNGGGTTAAMNLTLNDVTVKHTTFPRKLKPEPKFTNIGYIDNLGRCMDQYSWGHRNVNNLRIIDSHFSDCIGDGIGSDVSGGVSGQSYAGGIDLGDGKGDAVSIDIENSTVENTGQYALHFANNVDLADLNIRARNSRFSGAKGNAVVAFDQDGTTEHATIDLGGKIPGSPGHNCILHGKHLLAEVTGYDVSAKSNWWGRTEGPGPYRISVMDGHLQTWPALRVPPVSCGARP